MKSASFKNGHTKFVSGLRTPESDNGDDVSPNRVHPVVLNRLVKDLGAFLLILKYLSPEFYDCPEGGILLLGF